MYRRERSTGYSSFSMICSLLLAFVTRAGGEVIRRGK